MMKYPDYRAYQERVRQGSLNKDEDAMAKALEDYAREVILSGQVLESSKERMIQEARNYLHDMFKTLDDERD
jgi:hypothetical protein